MATRYRFATRQLPDYYDALGVPPVATGQQIEAAYWRRAYAASGPDELRLLNEALETLSHPERREVYDARREALGALQRHTRAAPSQPRKSIQDRLRERWDFG